MLIKEGLQFVQEYVSAINASIKKQEPEKALSKIQAIWLSFVILGTLVTNAVCWKRMEKASLGKYNSAALSWMFRNSKIFWELLLVSSVRYLLRKYNINKGILVIDDSDIQRSKKTSKIAKTHKIKDKKTGGYFNGQNIVFLILVSDKITLPVGFKFYEPDPDVSKWAREDKRLRKKGVKKKYRPEKPVIDDKYPGKKKIATELITSFIKSFADIKIKSVLADSLYGDKDFIQTIIDTTGVKQVISQIRKNQTILFNNKVVSINKQFEKFTEKKEEVILRGKKKVIYYMSAPLKVVSHKKKYRIIALKYEGESEYRYIIATDASWLDIDIIKAYSFRWLVEVFIQDWKTYEGWDQLAKQQGDIGSERGVILSLLSDHLLLLHNEQQSLVESKSQAATVGSLRIRVVMESISAFIGSIVDSSNPRMAFDEVSNKIAEVFELEPSAKHVSHLKDGLAI